MNGVHVSCVAGPTVVGVAGIRLRRRRSGQRRSPSRRDLGLRRSDVAGRRRSRGGVQGGEQVRCRLPDRAAVADRCGRHDEPRNPDLGRQRRLLRAGFRHVIGGRVRLYPRARVPGDLADAARIPATRAGRVASICTGAFVLAAAGLLDGKRATTHWKVAHELAARCPTCRVEPDAIYVRDGTTYTSAGVTAGIDLALALVEEDHGPDLARDVARALVVYMQRAGGQSQFSAPLQGPPPRSPALRKVTDLVTANPGGDHSLGELAKHLNVSTRHLTRLFHDELSTTPARYVENIRFDMARALLDQGHTATQAATLAGFPSYESVRRVFARKLSISPAAYQRRFSTARRVNAG